jgi:HAD superfamily hydrolase (TIGR01509 family)
VEPVKAVVFDVGGVLIEWDFRHIYRELLPTEEEIDWFLTTICTLEWHAQHDRGRPMAEGVAELIALHPEHAELIQAWEDRFPESWSGPISGTVELVGELKAAGIPLYALTNWPAEMFPLARERFEFLDWFDGTIVSGEVGMAKPDRAIFELARDRFGLEPAATLYIDDAATHVEAAREVGFQALLFTSPAALRAELSARGLVRGG